MRKLILAILLVMLLSGCAPGAAQAAEQPAPDSSGYIQNKGSDTIVNLALAWAERYQQLNPNFRISVTGGGTGTGMVGLVNGTVDIANASRKIKTEELEKARAAGREPREHVIARDAIAVIVNPTNPVNQLTLDQISRIFKGEITNWSQVGGEDWPIVRLSRESNSGTHVYFLESVIRRGNSKDKSLFSPKTLLLPSSEGIIAEVRDNPNAIGYDGLGYVTEEVKVIGVARSSGEDYIWPSIETVNNGQYPIARDLYMYTLPNASEQISRYLEWILSDEAQKIVGELGFVPVQSGGK